MELQSPRHNPYSTLASLLEDLKKEGYGLEFEVQDQNRCTDQEGNSYLSDDLALDAIYRFEAENEPDNLQAVYTLSSDKGDKGTLVDYYGKKADETVSLFLQNIDKEGNSVKKFY